MPYFYSFWGLELSDIELDLLKYLEVKSNGLLIYNFL